MNTNTSNNDPIIPFLNALPSVKCPNPYSESMKKAVPVAILLHLMKMRMTSRL